MKTYKIKNYKGNLVESLSKFQESHKDMKILEVREIDESLVIKVDESQIIKEARPGNQKFSVTLFLYRIDDPVHTKYRSSTVTYSCSDATEAVGRAQQYFGDDSSTKIEKDDVYVWAKEYVVHPVFSQSDINKYRERVRKWEKKHPIS